MNAPRLHQVIINHDYNYTYTMVLYGLILLIVISLSSIYFFKRVKYTNICEIKSIEYADDKVMDYVFTYIMPILSISLDQVESVIANSALFLMIWFLYIKLELMFINPLWTLLGYISYKYDHGYIITNIKYEELKRSIGHYPIKGAYISNRIFLPIEKIIELINICSKPLAYQRVFYTVSYTFLCKSVNKLIIFDF